MSDEQSFTQSKSVVIIGAGISGLAAAWILCKSGFDVTVLEQQKFVGGLAGSIKYKDYIADIGPHILLLPKQSLITTEVINLMGKDNLVEIDWPWAKSYFHGGFLNRSYPSLFDVVFKSGLSFFIRSSYAMLVSKLKISKANELKTAEDYFLFVYGKFLYSTWFKPFFSQRYGDLKHQPAEVAQNIFHPITIKRVIALIKRKLTQINKGNHPSNRFNCYPKYGMKSLIENIQKEIEKHDGKIILDVNVKSIIHNDKSKVVAFSKGEHATTLNADVVIYAIPPSTVLRWFDNVPTEIILESKKLNAIHCIMAFLFIDSPRLYDWWILTMFDTRLAVFRTSQQTFLSNLVAPSGKSILCVEMQVNENDPLWKSDDDLLKKKIINDLKVSNVLKQEKIEDWKIIRIKNVYPINISNNGIETITDFITSHKNEYVINTVTDPGRLASNIEKNSILTDPNATGIYRALLNADILAQEIVSNIKISVNP